MRIRQIALVAQELDGAVADILAVLGLNEGFNDPGVGSFGLHNSVMTVGDTFLEVVAPIQEGTTAARLLEKRNGDGGYMVILQTEDIAVERKRMDELGVRIVWSVDHDDATTIHLHPRDVGGAIVSLDVMRPPESWRWAGPGWEDRAKTDVTLEIVGAEIQSDDPRAMAERWAQVLDSPLSDAEDVLRVSVDGGEIRFVTDTDGRGQGVSGYDLRVANRDRILKTAQERGIATTENSVYLCGVHFYLTE